MQTSVPLAVVQAKELGADRRSRLDQAEPRQLGQCIDLDPYPVPAPCARTLSAMARGDRIRTCAYLLGGVLEVLRAQVRGGVVVLRVERAMVRVLWGYVLRWDQWRRNVQPRHAMIDGGTGTLISGRYTTARSGMVYTLAGCFHARWASMAGNGRPCLSAYILDCISRPVHHTPPDRSAAARHASA